VQAPVNIPHPLRFGFASRVVAPHQVNRLAGQLNARALLA